MKTYTMYILKTPMST